MQQQQSLQDQQQSQQPNSSSNNRCQSAGKPSSVSDPMDCSLTPAGNRPRSASSSMSIASPAGDALLKNSNNNSSSSNNPTTLAAMMVAKRAALADKGGRSLAAAATTATASGVVDPLHQFDEDGVVDMEEDVAVYMEDDAGSRQSRSGSINNNNNNNRMSVVNAGDDSSSSSSSSEKGRAAAVAVSGRSNEEERKRHSGRSREKKSDGEDIDNNNSRKNSEAISSSSNKGKNSSSSSKLTSAAKVLDTVASGDSSSARTAAAGAATAAVDAGVAASSSSSSDKLNNNNSSRARSSGSRQDQQDEVESNSSSRGGRLNSSGGGVGGAVSSTSSCSASDADLAAAASTVMASSTAVAGTTTNKKRNDPASSSSSSSAAGATTSSSSSISASSASSTSAPAPAPAAPLDKKEEKGSSEKSAAKNNESSGEKKEKQQPSSGNKDSENAENDDGSNGNNNNNGDDERSESGSTTSNPSKPKVLYTHPKNPMRKLSVKLLATYQHINEVYYQKKRRQQEQLSSLGKKTHSVVNAWDDEHGDYRLHVGDLINGRYEIVSASPLGKGSFGVVVKALDQQERTEVALKIIKNRKTFYEQAQTEKHLLQRFKDCGEEVLERVNIVSLKDHFVHKDHQCLVFELLGLSLYDLLKRTRHQGVSLNLVRKFGKQILMTLQFLSLPSIGVVHCDLKPENVLLRNSVSCLVKCIDFGSSCPVDRQMYQYIQSRFYRSPEVLFCLKYGHPIDMWSLGCILVEMHTGVPVFNGREEREQIVKIVQVLGLPPSRMINPESKCGRLFTKNEQGKYELRWHGQPVIPGRYPLRETIGVDTGGPGSRRKDEPGHSQRNYLLFLDLVQKMLTYDPKERILPAQAMAHGFFTDFETEMPSSTAATATASTSTTPAPASAPVPSSSSSAAATKASSVAGGRATDVGLQTD